MMKLLLLLLAAMAFVPAAFAQNDNLSETALRQVYVSTANAVEPSCTILSAPDGCSGSAIDADKVSGRLSIVAGSSTVYDSGNYVKDESGITIKVRGNGSADKKSFKVKLQKKADLLARSSDTNFKDKEWVLLNDADLKDVVGFWVNSLVGLPWTPGCELVELYINNDYRGVYLLAESVKRNDKCRINVDEDAGYILERDASWWAEDVYFSSPFFASDLKFRWSFKYPDSDDVLDSQVSFIQQAVSLMEEAISSGTYDSYLDVQSFAAWLLGYDILGATSDNGLNVYLAKADESDNSKIFMTNMWDFGSIYKAGSYDYASIHSHARFYFPQLFASSNTAFAQAYYDAWTNAKSSLFTSVIGKLDALAASSFASALQSARTRDDVKWGTSSQSVADEIVDAKAWFSSRQSMLKAMIEDGKTAIPNVSVATVSSPVCYTLSGVRATSNSTGLVVRDGRLCRK